MIAIFPPVLEGRRESIWFEAEGNMAEKSFEIMFNMPQANAGSAAIRHLQLSIRYKNSVRPAVNTSMSPDKATLFCSCTEDTTRPSPAYSYDVQTGICRLRVPYNFFDGGRPKNGCEYIIQIRFGSNDLWDGNAPGWHTTWGNRFQTWWKTSTMAVPSTFGEWSNVQQIFCIDRAVTSISIDKSDFVPTIKWEYKPNTDAQISDAIEQVVLQWDWNTVDHLGNIVRQYRSKIFNGQYQNSDTYVFTAKIPIAPIKDIHVSVDAVTIHNTHYTDNQNIISNPNNPYFPSDNDGVLLNHELLSHQTDDGCVAKELYMAKKVPNGYTMSLYRYNLKTLDCIKLKEGLLALEGEHYIVKDYTVEMGEEYQYVGVLKEANGLMVELFDDLYKFGEGTEGYARLTKMEVSFLNNRYHQLRLHGGVNISSFKRNTSDQFQTTIGGQFPYYIRNGAQNYRTLQISAVISANFDPTFTFLNYLDGIGLEWRDPIGNTMLVKYEDLFSSEEFSHSVMRMGYPKGYYKELPRFNQLGKDGGFGDGTDEDEAYRITFNAYQDYKKGINISRFNSDANYRKEVQDTLYDYRQKLDTLYKNLRDEDYHVSSQQFNVGPKSVFSSKLVKNVQPSIGTEQTDENIFIERKFRDMVMSWLSDGKPKLFRSETEGNMIVIVSQPNFTPLQKTQRMVYQVSMTLTEIAEYNLENLIEYNLIPSEIISNYTPTGEWDIHFGNPDPWVTSSLVLSYSPIYDIPASTVGTSIKIDLSTSVKNGTPGYHWSAIGLPKGLTIDEVTGIISGVIIEPTPGPSIAIISCTDSIPSTDTMQINVGRMYEALSITPQTTRINQSVVGSKIPEVFFKVDPANPGSPPYTWSVSSDIPQGLDYRAQGTNLHECVIFGAFRQELTKEMKTFEIFCTDSLGQITSAIIQYTGATLPLTFEKLPQWELISGWEEGEPIDQIHFLEGVSGGVEPYTFSMTNIPAGITLAKGDGTLSGVPQIGLDYPMKPRSCVVTVKDANGDEKSIVIVIDTILEAFVFIKPTDIDVTLYGDSLGRGASITPYKIMEKFIADDGTPVATGGRPPVRGGLERIKPPKPYEFYCTSTTGGILDNFSVNGYGVLTGYTIQTCEAGVLRIYARDQRNRERYIDVLIPAVVGTFRIPPNIKFNIPEMAIDDRRNIGVATPVWFTITADDMENEEGSWTDYSASIEGVPPGVTIVKDVAGRVFRVQGQITGEFPSGVGTIQITDGKGQQASASISIGGIYSTLTWNGVTTIPPQLVREKGEIAKVGLPQVYGGKKPWRILNITAPYPYKVYPQDAFRDPDAVYITGVPNVVQGPVTVRILLEDALNRQVSVPVNIGEIYSMPEVVMNPPWKNQFILQQSDASLTDMKLGVVSSGKGPFIWTYDGGSLLPNGMKLNPDGTITGKATVTHPAIDLGPKLVITDQGTGGTIPAGTYILPATVEPPKLNPNAPWENDNKTVIIDNLTQNDGYASAFSLFVWQGAATATTIGQQDLPLEIKVVPNKWTLEGSIRYGTVDDTVANITLVIEKDEITPQQNVNATVIFKPIAAIFQLAKVPPDLEFPSLGVNEAMEPLIVSNGLEGGKRPYQWTVTGLPNGLTFKVSGANNEVCTITGTPTAENKDGFIVTVQVKESSGKTDEIQLRCRGIFQPLKVTNPPKMTPNPGTELTTPIELNNYISGGSGDKSNYQVIDSTGQLSEYGLSIGDGNQITGTWGNFALPARTIELTVKDNFTNQIKKMQLNVDKLDGDLNISPKDYSVAPDSRGKIIPVINLSANVYGKTGTVTYSIDPAKPIPSDWRRSGGYGVQLTSDGRITGNIPNKKASSGSFGVIIKDGSGNDTYAVISLPAVS